MIAAVFSQSVLSTAGGGGPERVAWCIPLLTRDTYSLHGAPRVGSCRQIHLLENQGQRQERCVTLNNRAAHHRGAKGDGAAVLNASSLYLQDHILEGMKLKDAIHHTVVAKVHRVPSGALHWLRHDRSTSYLTSHPL